MSDKQTEALKLALEALDLAKHSHGKMLLSDPPQEAWRTYRVDDALNNAITAIREALEQPAQQQEPVAWMYPSDYEKCLTSEHVAEVTSIECTSLRTGEKTTVPLYTSPQPSKPWVSLTDEEIEARAINFYNPEMYKRAVLWAQEKLKERNQ